jgi:hypothetical protein
MENDKKIRIDNEIWEKIKKVRGKTLDYRSDKHFVYVAVKKLLDKEGIL